MFEHQKVRFNLKRPYTKEEIKQGYDNSVNGREGVITSILDKGIVEVTLNEPLKWKGKNVYIYTDSIENIEPI